MTNLSTPFPWNSTDPIPLEEALRLTHPVQSCCVYLIEVGGEKYIGMTTLLPEVALNNHLNQARAGNTTKLHKALRRFGYLCDFSTLSTHDSEIDCLVEKVSQIQRIKPSLNITFGGEGYNFNLVERPNEFGEKVLFVENKRLLARLAHENRKSHAGYIQSLLKRAANRYDRLEHTLPPERYRFAESVFPVPMPSHLMPSSYGTVQTTYTREEFFDYLKNRSIRYQLLRSWSEETQKLIFNYAKLDTFISTHQFKLLTKSPKALFNSFTYGGKVVTYTPNYEGSMFNPDFFKILNASLCRKTVL